MLGRGRARLVVDEGLGIPPRRPGMPPSSYTSSSVPNSKLLISQSNLSLLDPLTAEPADDVTIFKAIQAYLTISNSPGDIDKFIDTIFTRVVKNAVNSDLIAKYVWIASKFKSVDGESITRRFFQELEIQFSIWGRSKPVKVTTEYRNFVQFFCSIAHFTRNRSNAPFDDLVNALFVLMEPLLNSTNDEDLALLSMCVIRYSKFLKLDSSGGYSMNISNSLENLMVEMRKKIEACDGLSEKGIAWLLFGLEAAHTGFDGLSNSAQLHYVGILSHEVYSLGEQNEKIKIPKEDASKYSLDGIDPKNIFLI